MYGIAAFLSVCFACASAATKNYGEFVPGACDVHQTQGGWNYRQVEGSCNQYLTCDEQSKAFLMTCAAGTFFSDNQKCRQAEEVDCLYDPCRHLPAGAAFNDGQSCYGFYVCKKGKSFFQTCKNGYTFHPHKQMCIPDYSCKRDNLAHPCSFGTTYPVVGRSDFFYLFDGHHRFTPMKCPDGLWYNPDLCTCDWVVPGETIYGKCKPMFHFSYDGNFLEKWNRVQQVPNSQVSIFQKSAIFAKGGKIIIWTLNDMELTDTFALCFEFMAKNLYGEVALISNDFNHTPYTLKITYIRESAILRGYIVLADNTVAELTVLGVDPNSPHFVRLAKFDNTLKLRVDNMPAAIVKATAGVVSNNSPMVIGAASGCEGLMGYFDEFKFFRCLPRGFFKDYMKK